MEYARRHWRPFSPFSETENLTYDGSPGCGIERQRVLKANGVECESLGWRAAQPWVEGDRCIRPNGAGGARALYGCWCAHTGHMKFVTRYPRVALRSTLGYRRFAPLGQMNIPDVVGVTENSRLQMAVELDGMNIVDY